MSHLASLDTKVTASAVIKLLLTTLDAKLDKGAIQLRLQDCSSQTRE